MTIVRQPKWDKYETSLLIEAYWAIKYDSSKRRTIVSELSSTLRKRAILKIDDTFRNENGINMRLLELDYLFSEGKSGLKNTSYMFREMVDMYQNNRKEFEKILSEAKLTKDDSMKMRDFFCVWLRTKANKFTPEEVCQLLAIGEKYCRKFNVITLPLFKITDVKKVKKFVNVVTKDKVFRKANIKQYRAIIDAANWYLTFVKALPELLPTGQERERTDFSTNSNNKNDKIKLEDTILDYFDSISPNYPEFVFTNHNAKDEIVNRTVYIFPKESKRHGNVLFEIWHLAIEGQFHLLINNSLLTSEEIKESHESWDRTTGRRGRITRKWQSRQELIDYLVPKLELAKKNIEQIEHATKNAVQEEQIVSFSGGQDYNYTKPLWYRYKSSNKLFINTWCGLYTMLMRQIVKDYPTVFFANMSFLKGTIIDIVDKSESGKLRKSSELTDNLLIETNIAAAGIVKRIAVAASLIGLTEDSIEIHFSKKNIEAQSSKSSAISQNKERTREKASQELVTKVDELIRKSLNGITKAQINKLFSNYSTHQINLALESCHIVLVLKRYYHQDNISDYYEMADILLEVISRQFSQNGDYTSARQLYIEARPRLDDFFFYNNAFDSRQEVYDLALHLFEREKYKGKSFIFMNNTHIWKEEPDYPKDYHGLMIKYAREHGNTFSREEAVSYFEQIGSTTPSATFSSVIFNTGNKSFLQYDENQFVLTEAVEINDYFLASVSTQIENLLEGDDYVATGEIDDFFYTTLPKLPNGIYWSALLLKDLLKIYNTDFVTIEAGKNNDKKTFPAAIIRKNSCYRSFGDVVWNEVSKSFALPKEFTASEFREFLLEKGFIRGSEKTGNVHKTVEGDIRFYWIDNNEKVTIN